MIPLRRGLALVLLAGALPAQQPRIAVEHFLQRGSAWDAALRGRAPDTVRVCGGGLAEGFGGTRPSREALLHWLGSVDAIVLAGSDLPFWSEMNHEYLPLLSANLRDRDGQRPGLPFLVRSAGNVRLSLVAVTTGSAPEGFGCDEPLAAVQAVLQDASKDSDALLLLVDGDRQAAAALLAALPQVAGAIAFRGARAAAQPVVLDGRFVVQSPQAGTALGQLVLQKDADRLRLHGHRFTTAFLGAWEQGLAARLRGELTVPVPLEDDLDKVPVELAGFGIDPAQVAAAVDRGVQALLADLDAEGRGPDARLGGANDHVLAALALVHAGLHETDPAFDQEVRRFLRARDVTTLGTYAAGLFCMLVEAYGRPEFYGRLRECARWLVEGQSAGGSWTYHPKVDPSLCNDPDRRVLQVTGGETEVPEAAAAEWRRVTPWNTHAAGDNSLTQFALLGLRAAQRCGVVVPAETWRRAQGFCRRGQRQVGGFGYAESGSDAYGSMTLAGVCSLAICAHMLGESDFGADAGVRRGLHWLRQHFAVDRNPGSGGYLHYYLYSLERTGRILDRPFVSGQEWYPLGCKQLLAMQQPGGAWADVNGGEVVRLATSFALLFLTRSTQQLRIERQRGGSGTLVTAVQTPPGSRFYVVLDASGSMLEKTGTRTRFDIARGAVLDLLAALPMGAQVALRVYGHRKRAIEPGADADTELLLPLQPLDREQVAGRLQALRARGRTPLALSLREAAKDLAGGDRDSRVTLLLLTDGGEDSVPRQDPVAAAAELAKIPNLRLHVVGFDIRRDDWRRQLLALARAGNGDYRAAEGDGLAAELRSAVLLAPDGFVLQDEHGAELRRARFGDRLTLPEGRYRLVTSYGGREFAAQLGVQTEATTSVVFDGSRALAVVQGLAPTASGN